MNKLTLDDGKLAVTFHDVTGGNTERVDDLVILYEKLMPAWAYYSRKIREIAEKPSGYDPRFVEHQWLAEVDGKPVGFTLYRYIPNRRCAIGVGLGVEEAYRKIALKDYMSFGHMLNRLTLLQICWDAQLRGEPVPAGLVVEVGNPAAVSDEEQRKYRAHLVFRYIDYGMSQIDVDYYEPPDIFETIDQIDPNRGNYLRSLVGIFPILGTPYDHTDPRVMANLTMALHIEHYGLTYDHWAVQAALRKS